MREVAKGADAPARRLRGQTNERYALGAPHLSNLSSPRGREACTGSETWLSCAWRIKKEAARRRPLVFVWLAWDYIPMPPMPPMSGAGAAAFGSGFSAIIASVVIIKEATDAAS